MPEPRDAPTPPSAPTSPSATTRPPQAPAPGHAAQAHGTRRLLLLAAGVVALGLGLLGVVVPGLPTTPFVLLAASCFAKASPRLHRWLSQHRYLGPMVRDWEAHRTLPRRVKWLATAMMVTMVLLSAWQLAPRPWLQGLVLALGALGAWVVWRIPTRH